MQEARRGAPGGHATAARGARAQAARALGQTFRALHCPALWTALGTLGVAATLLLPSALPLLDEPVHLGLTRIVSDLWHRPTSTPLANHYALALKPAPYSLLYALGALISPILGVFYAHKAVLVFYACSYPVVAALFLRALGKPTWYALLTLCLPFGNTFGLGFHSSNLGSALGLWACLLLFLLARTPTATRALGAAVALTLAFAAHPAAAALPGLFTLTLFACHIRRISALLAMTLAWTPVFAWLFHTLTTWPSLPKSTGIMNVFASFPDAIQHLPSSAFGALTGPLPVIVLAAIAASLFASVTARIALGAARRDHNSGATDVPPAQDRWMVVTAVVMLTLYFVVPQFSTFPTPWWAVNDRVTGTALFFLVLALPRIPPNVARFAVLPGAVASVTFLASLGSAYLAFNADNEPAFRFLTATPPGARTIMLSYPPRTFDGLPHDPYRNISGWTTATRAIPDEAIWRYPHMPETRTSAWPSPPVLSPAALSSKGLEFFDTIIVRKLSGTLERKLQDHGWVLVAEEQDWRYYRAQDVQLNRAQWAALTQREPVDLVDAMWAAGDEPSDLMTDDRDGDATDESHDDAFLTGPATKLPPLDPTYELPFLDTL